MSLDHGIVWLTMSCALTKHGLLGYFVTNPIFQLIAKMVIVVLLTTIAIASIADLAPPANQHTLSLACTAVSPCQCTSFAVKFLVPGVHCYVPPANSNIINLNTGLFSRTVLVCSHGGCAAWPKRSAALPLASVKVEVGYLRLSNRYTGHPTTNQPHSR